MTTAALTRDDVLDFEVAPMQAALGAEVRGLDLRHLNDATFKPMHDAWLHHVLLIFKEQTHGVERVWR